MKLFICILLLTSTTLAISNKNASDVTVLLLPKDLHDSALKYYHKFRNSTEDGKAVTSIANDLPKNYPTFPVRQKLRDQAWHARHGVLDVLREINQRNVNGKKMMQALSNKIGSIKKHFEGLFQKQNQICQGLKFKINHEARFREMYSKRAQENMADAMTEADPSSKKRKEDLANWDTEQTKKYAGKCANHLKDLKANEAKEANWTFVKNKKCEAKRKQMLVLQAKLDSENAEGERRLKEIQNKESGLLMRVRKGESTSQAMDRIKKMQLSRSGAPHLPTLAAPKKKLVAQSGKFVGLVPNDDAPEQGQGADRDGMSI